MSEITGVATAVVLPDKAAAELQPDVGVAVRCVPTLTLHHFLNGVYVSYCVAHTVFQPPTHSKVMITLQASS